MAQNTCVEVDNLSTISFPQQLHGSPNQKKIVVPNHGVATGGNDITSGVIRVASYWMTFHLNLYLTGVVQLVAEITRLECIRPDGIKLSSSTGARKIDTVAIGSCQNLQPITGFER